VRTYGEGHHSFLIVDEGTSEALLPKEVQAGHIRRTVTGVASSHMQGRAPRKTYAYYPVRDGMRGYRINDWHGGMDISVVLVSSTDTSTPVEALRGTQPCGCCKTVFSFVFAVSPEAAIQSYKQTLPLGPVSLIPGSTTKAFTLWVPKGGALLRVGPVGDDLIVQLSPRLKNVSKRAFAQLMAILSTVQDHLHSPKSSTITKLVGKQGTE